MRFLLGLFFLNSLGVFSQFKGQVVSENETPIAGATVYNKTKKGPHLAMRRAGLKFWMLL